MTHHELLQERQGSSDSVFEHDGSLGASPGLSTKIEKDVLVKRGSNDVPSGPRVHRHREILLSDGPAVCRICHGGEMSSPFTTGSESLISPCFCSGTMGLYHRSCLEKWLSTSNTAHCEICKFQYVTERYPKPFLTFIVNPGSVVERRSMIGDFICWCVLTPLAVSSTFLCIQGAVHYSNVGKDHVEVPGLVCLAVFLILTYLIWLSVSLRYHYKVWRQWQKKNQVVRIMDIDDEKRAAFSPPADCNNNNNSNAVTTISGGALMVPLQNSFPAHSMLSVAGRPPNHTSTPANPTSATLTIRFDYNMGGFLETTASGTTHETMV